MKTLKLLAFVAMFAPAMADAQLALEKKEDFVTVESGTTHDGRFYEVRMAESVYKSRMTNMLDLNWFDEIWAESVTVNFDRDFGGTTYDLYVSKVEWPFNFDDIIPLWGLAQYGLTGSGTEEIDITGLYMGTGWHGLIQVADDDGTVVEEMEIWPITQIEQAFLSINDMPIPNGIQTGFVVTLPEYGYEGFPNKIQTLYYQRTDLNTGVVNVEDTVIMGVGNTTQITFYHVYNPNHTYEICAWFTYEDGGLASLWGPYDIISTCGNPLTYPAISMGVAELASTAVPSIFPNPAADWVTISGFATGETLDIVDGSGRLVRGIDSSMATHQVSDLASGVYLIRAQDGQRFVRFVKN